LVAVLNGVANAVAQSRNHRRKCIEISLRYTAHT
jgi:hypothetical protein